ncbi:hypothetical protein LRY58_03590 [Candidatus Woesebacteria bacterium]|nr:hypothetical protein [Candidatus Woesebacteria bacterium]
MSSENEKIINFSDIVARANSQERFPDSQTTHTERRTDDLPEDVLVRAYAMFAIEGTRRFLAKNERRDPILSQQMNLLQGKNNYPEIMKKQFAHEYRWNPSRGHLFPYSSILTVHPETLLPILFSGTQKTARQGILASHYLFLPTVERPQNKLALMAVLRNHKLDHVPLTLVQPDTLV